MEYVELILDGETRAPSVRTAPRPRRDRRAPATRQRGAAAHHAAASSAILRCFPATLQELAV
eukprot:6202917-Pleurochrysis_carterae.AAC.3